MPPRLYLPQPLRAGERLELPPGPARHVQVLRLQPGAALTLFDGHGGEWSATVLQLGRQAVDVQVGTHDPVERELPGAVTLALAMPANDRMDTLVEKATELGVAAIQPLHAERSVLRLRGERADRKRQHWEGVAIAACEQCGRTRVPHIEPVRELADWLAACAATPAGVPRWLLSLRDARPFDAPAGIGGGLFLSGPEGGWTADEEAAAWSAGFAPVSLGTRVLRADTAPLAALAAIAVAAQNPPAFGPTPATPASA